MATDYAKLLDQTEPQHRADLLRRTLSQPRQALIEDWEVTVAAAAMIAAHCPGGKPTHSVYGAQSALPLPVPADLPDLAAAALNAVLLDTRLAASWASDDLLSRWRTHLVGLHAVLTDASAPAPHTGPAPHPRPAPTITPPPAPGSVRR
jgi:hypothetical protein